MNVCPSFVLKFFRIKGVKIANQFVDKYSNEMIGVTPKIIFFG